MKQEKASLPLLQHALVVFEFIKLFQTQKYKILAKQPYSQAL